MSKQPHFSMIRQFHLADWLTLGNAFCGTGAVFAAMRFLQDGQVRYLLWGMALVPIAAAAEALDFGFGERLRERQPHVRRRAQLGPRELVLVALDVLVEDVLQIGGRLELRLRGEAHARRRGAGCASSLRGYGPR